LIPGFRSAFEQYLDQVQNLSQRFSTLIAESFGLGSEGLAGFYDTPQKMQHRAKIVRYPVTHDGSDQGVGPHYDAGFLTFVRRFQNFFPHTEPFIPRILQLLQASPHRGLQVQNLSGEWIDTPPIPGTFVVNIGKGKYFSLLS